MRAATAAVSCHRAQIGLSYNNCKGCNSSRNSDSSVKLEWKMAMCYQHMPQVALAHKERSLLHSSSSNNSNSDSIAVAAKTHANVNE
jgi:hypothetical protein